MSLKLTDAAEDTVLSSSYTIFNDYAGPFSFSLWLKSEDDVATVSTANVFGWVNTAVDTINTFYLRLGASGSVVAGYTDDTETEHNITAAAAFADGAWHHIAYTCTDGAQKLYVNGALVASGTEASVVLLDNYGEFYIKAGTGAYRIFENVAVFDRVLTAGEIIRLRDKLATEGGLGASHWWKMDATSGTSHDGAATLTEEDLSDVVSNAGMYDLDSGGTAWADDVAEYVPPTEVVETPAMFFVDYDNGDDSNDGLSTIGITHAASSCIFDGTAFTIQFDGIYADRYSIRAGDVIYWTGTGWSAQWRVTGQYDEENGLPLHPTPLTSYGTITTSQEQATSISNGPKRTIQGALDAAGNGTGNHKVYLMPGVHVVDLDTGLTASCPASSGIVEIKKTPFMSGPIHIVSRKCRVGRRSVTY